MMRIHTPGFANISTLSHPTYLQRWEDWEKWRLAYECDDDFKQKYLRKFSNRETQSDFNERRQITPIPGFARAAINEIKNSIFQRTHDVIRIDGDPTYSDASAGLEGGVDFRGSTMHAFIGQDVLPELLSMGTVGVFVDMPELQGDSVVEAAGARPYLYVYQVEQIRNWQLDRQGFLTSVLLQRDEFEIDPEMGLPVGFSKKRDFIHMFINASGTVTVRRLDESGEETQPERVIDIPIIPFVILQLTDSLMRNAADYQIALMNLESSDIAYVLKANFPFYTEQADPRAVSVGSHLEPVEAVGDADAVNTQPRRNAAEVHVGVVHGRRYGINTDRPGFIAPPTEPLEASMQKQERMKADIRLLVNLSVQNLKPGRNQSAESQKQGLTDLESGLSCVGLELQRGETHLAFIWSQYMGSKPARVTYPETYTIKTPEERREEVKSLSKELTYVPVSNTYKKEVAKKIARTTLGTSVSMEVLRKIEKEIDAAKVIDTDVAALQKDVEEGIATRDTVADARGYPKGEAKKAEAEHALRLERIKKSQTPDDGADENAGARGNDDESVAPNEEARNEKATSQDRDQVAEGSPVRGDAD